MSSCKEGREGSRIQQVSTGTHADVAEYMKPGPSLAYAEVMAFERYSFTDFSDVSAASDSIDRPDSRGLFTWIRLSAVEYASSSKLADDAVLLILRVVETFDPQSLDSDPSADIASEEPRALFLSLAARRFLFPPAFNSLFA